MRRRKLLFRLKPKQILNTEEILAYESFIYHKIAMASNLNLPPLPPKLKPIGHLLKTATGKIL